MKNLKETYLPILFLSLLIYSLDQLVKVKNQATFTTVSFLIGLIIFYRYFFIKGNDQIPIKFQISIFNNFTNLTLLFLLTILTQNKYLNIETITWDVPSYLVASQEINQGFIPLETQWESKGPIFLYLYNIFSIISNKNYIIFRLVNDIILFLSVAFLYLTVFNKTNNKVKSFFSSFLFILITSHVWFVSEFSEIYCLAVLSSIYYIFNRYEHKSYLLALLGFLFSISTLINQGTVIFLVPYFIVLFNEFKKNNLIRNMFYFFIGFIFPHLMFLLIYLVNGMFDIYISQYIFIPLGYIQANQSSFYELKVVLRRYFEYDVFLYFSIFSLLVFSFQTLLKQLSIKKFKIFNDLSYLNLLTAIIFYFIAGHNYYHHLFYAIFFFSIVIIKIEFSNQRNLATGLLLVSFISLGFKTFPDSLYNLTNINKIYNNYPLKQLSEEIDINFSNDKYDILAMDYVLILYYLDKPNYSYIVHPSNHYEDFIVSELLRLQKIEVNEFSHISKMIEDEPEVIICNPKMVIKGIPEKIDFYNCAVDDYKKNYKKLETMNYKNNQNLDYYSDPYKEINVFINKSKQ